MSGLAFALGMLAFRGPEPNSRIANFFYALYVIAIIPVVFSVVLSAGLWGDLEVVDRLPDAVQLFLGLVLAVSPFLIMDVALQLKRRKDRKRPGDQDGESIRLWT